MSKPNDPYLDPDSGVLINRFGITDSGKLAKLETELVGARYRQFLENPIKGKFDQAHLQAIHKHLFEPVYFSAGEHKTPFAGAIRIIGIEKKGDGVSYPHPDHPIEPLSMRLDYTFSELNKETFTKEDLDRTASKLAEHLAEIWGCHPFRDGNTRTNFLFGLALAKSHGIDFNLNGANIKQYRVAIREYARDGGDKQAFMTVVTELINSPKYLSHNEFDIAQPENIQAIDPDALKKAESALDRETKKGLDALERKHKKTMSPIVLAKDDAKKTLDAHVATKPSTENRLWLDKHRDLKQRYGVALRAVTKTEGKFKSSRGERFYLAKKRALELLPQESKLVSLHTDRQQAKDLLERWRTLESELKNTRGPKDQQLKTELIIRESLDRVFRQFEQSPGVKAALPEYRRSMLQDKYKENTKQIEQSRNIERGRGVTR